MATRLGLFGGTFDPPHLGHVAALHAAIRSGRFDAIEVTVAGDPYQKSASQTVHPAPTRLAMAHAAFDTLDLVVVSDREIRREGPSYTIDTVRELLATFDMVDVIVGADLVPQLDSWREAETLKELVAVGVVPRPGAPTLLPAGWCAYELPMDPVDLSSTFIRDIGPNWENIGNYLPTAVIPLFAQASK